MQMDATFFWEHELWTLYLIGEQPVFGMTQLSTCLDFLFPLTLNATGADGDKIISMMIMIK